MAHMFEITLESLVNINMGSIHYLEFLIEERLILESWGVFSLPQLF